MTRPRSRKTYVSGISLKGTGLLSQSDPRNESDRWRRALIRDLQHRTLVGPAKFPIKNATAEALFQLALQQLSKHDQATVDALHRYAGRYGRLEELELEGVTFRKSPVNAAIARIEWLYTEPSTRLIDELLRNFAKFRNEYGRQTCSTKCIQRQDKQLRAYCRDNSYPVGSHIKRNGRSAWAREHVEAMIANAQIVPCWHSFPDTTKRELDLFARRITHKTSPSQLSALLIAHLHSIGADYISKRILPRRRQ